MVYRFLMMEGNRPVECSVSNAVFKYLEKSRYYSDNVDAVFLRWRETIERRYIGQILLWRINHDDRSISFSDLTKRRE
jgi:hypothetical protein